MSALQAEIEPFGIDTTIVNPGFFRTELISEKSMPVSEPSITDYNKRRAEQIEWWWNQQGKQPGDPANLVQALIKVINKEPPPRRFIAGSDAIELAEQKAAELQEQIDAYRELSTSLAFDDAQ